MPCSCGGIAALAKTSSHTGDNGLGVRCVDIADLERRKDAAPNSPLVERGSSCWAGWTAMTLAVRMSPLLATLVAKSLILLDTPA